MKRPISFALAACVLAAGAGCSGGTGKEGGKPYDPEKLASIVPTVYDNELVKEISETSAGDIDTWKGQVYTRYGKNNDDPTEDSLIKSPFHKLTVNGVDVPVYSARCALGVHSFAWVDVTSHKDDFVLAVTLETDRPYKKCVVLPEKSGVTAEAENGKYISVITEYGSYTYTFAIAADAEATDPALAPITLMVTEEEPPDIPAGYDVHTVEPGYHGTGELEFKEPHMVYVIKAGLHYISELAVPSESIVYLERGAYLKCDPRGGQPALTVHGEDGENLRLLGRGLLDMGAQQGGTSKYKNVINFKRVDGLELRGLTVINSNNWTINVSNSDRAAVENCLLLGYRTYSDGIMMSECRDSAGRYNFVRTGDDGIEFKATGWAGEAEGRNCVYENNCVWNDKASAYGVIWESACSMSDMTFRNNSVGFGQPTWQTYSNVLDCRLGRNPNAVWSNILFTDFEIYRVTAYHVLSVRMWQEGARLGPVTFRNIDVKHADAGVYLFVMYYSSTGGVISDIRLEKIRFKGKKITAADRDDETVMRNAAGEWFKELTVE